MKNIKPVGDIEADFLRARGIYRPLVTNNWSADAGWPLIHYFEAMGYRFDEPSPSGWTEFTDTREGWSQALELLVAHGEPGFINYDRIRHSGRVIARTTFEQPIQVNAGDEIQITYTVDEELPDL